MSKTDEDADFISKKISYMCQAIYGKLSEAGVNEFGSLKSNLERFTYIWNHVDTPVIMSLEPEYDLKSIETAQAHRAKGNEYFQQQKYLTALGEYNISVQFAPLHINAIDTNDDQNVENSSPLSQVQDNQINNENFNNKTEQSSQVDATLSNGNSFSTNGADSANIATKEIPKNELALAFANRSAALFHLKRYRDCLLDIELAFESKYPEEMHHKLYERQGASLREMGRISDAMVSFQKAIDALSVAGLPPKSERTRKDVLTKLLDSCRKMEDKPKIDAGDKNQIVVPSLTGEKCPTHPRASYAVKVQYNNIIGRHVVAARDAKVGDVLMAENPFTSVILPGKYAESHCYNCFSLISVPVPCSQCSAVLYCSRDCRNSAWDVYHRVECSYGELLKPSSCAKIGHLALRLVMTVGIDPLLAYLKTNSAKVLSPEQAGLSPEGIYSGDYNSVFHLVGNANTRTPEDLLDFTVLACFLMKILEVSGYLKRISDCAADVELIGGAMLSHLFIIQCNAKRIVELSYPERFDDPKPVFVGVGLYPTVALVNHSCDPNADLNFYGNSVVIRAIRNIYEGEEICISYGPTFYEVKHRTRISQLKGAFHFTCRCEACRENWPVVEEMFDEVPKYKCEKCRCPLVVEDKFERKLFTCAICKHKQDMEELVGKLQISFDAYARAMNTAMNGRSDAALPDFVQHMLLLQGHVRHPWRDLCSCQSAVKQCYRLSANVKQR